LQFVSFGRTYPYTSREGNSVILSTAKDLTSEFRPSFQDGPDEHRLTVMKTVDVSIDYTVAGKELGFFDDPPRNVCCPVFSYFECFGKVKAARALSANPSR
jgi:hypothetical protein